MRHRTILSSTLPSSSSPSKNDRQIIFNTRCNNEINQLYELYGKNNNKLISGISISFPPSSSFSNSNILDDKNITSATSTTSATYIPQPRGYQFMISMNELYYNQLYYKYYTTTHGISNNIDMSYPTWLSKLCASEFILEIYDFYPFECPSIQCIAFPKIGSHLQILGIPSKSFTQLLLQDEWIPSITLLDLVHLLTHFVDDELCTFFRCMDVLNHPKSDVEVMTIVKQRILNDIEAEDKHKVIHPQFVFNTFNQPYGKWLLFVTAFLFLLFIRIAVGLGSYSGEGRRDPKYGDYEAQRHWMELTVNLPINEWYVETPNNPYSWWGLDYPPLSAYHALIMGKLSKVYEPASMVLLESRGYETASHKLFMRWTVIAADVIFMFSGAMYYWMCVKAKDGVQRRSSWVTHFVCLLTLLSCPVFLLIDHGHFQYNCVSLGLLIWSISLIGRRCFTIASIAFVLALLYKQTMLYYAPPFFFLLVGLSARRLTKTGMKMIISREYLFIIVYRIAKLGLTVCCTALIVCLPLLQMGLLTAVQPTNSFEYLLTSLHLTPLIPILRRVFPFHRGLYEDYVSNFWVLVSPLHAVKQLASSQPSTAMVTATTLTAIAILPSCINLMFRPTLKRFLVALFNSSMAFYLFSWQVHEKAVAQPLLPLLLMIDEHGKAALSFTLISSLSLLHLAIKDHIIISTTSLTAIWLYFSSIAIYSISTHVEPHTGPLPLRTALKYYCMRLRLHSTLLKPTAFSSWFTALLRFLSDTFGIHIHSATRFPPPHQTPPYGRPPPTSTSPIYNSIQNALSYLYQLHPLAFNSPPIPSTPNSTPPNNIQTTTDRRTCKQLSQLMEVHLGEEIRWKLGFCLLITITLILTTLQLFVKPPLRWPYLFVYFTSSFCCLFFMLALLISTIWQFTLPSFDSIFPPDDDIPIISSSDSLVAITQFSSDNKSSKKES